MRTVVVEKHLLHFPRISWVVQPLPEQACGITCHWAWVITYDWGLENNAGCYLPTHLAPPPPTSAQVPRELHHSTWRLLIETLAFFSRPLDFCHPCATTAKGVPTRYPYSRQACVIPFGNLECTLCHHPCDLDAAMVKS